jgi:hypothetical protein
MTTHSVARTWALVLILSVFTAVAIAGERRASKSRTNRKQATAEKVELFAAIEADQIEVKFIAKSNQEANVVIKNKTDKLLAVELPQVFAAVPILAQVGPVGRNQGNVGQNNNNNSMTNQNQGLGGGFGGGGLGGGGLGGFGGGGGGFFNVRPEQVAKLEVACVCLEHGKEDPRPKIPYEIRPLNTFTENAEVHHLLAMFATGKLDQRAAQAAAWHLQDGLSWQELAAKQIDHVSGLPDPFFKPHEIRMAMSVAEEARIRAERARQERSTSEESLSKKLAQSENSYPANAD